MLKLNDYENIKKTDIYWRPELLKMIKDEPYLSNFTQHGNNGKNVVYATIGSQQSYIKGHRMNKAELDVVH